MDDKWKDNYIYNHFIKQKKNSSGQYNGEEYEMDILNHANIQKARKLYFKTLSSWRKSMGPSFPIKIWINTHQKWFNGFVKKLSRNDDDIQIIATIVWQFDDDPVSWKCSKVLLHSTHIRQRHLITTLNQTDEIKQQESNIGVRCKSNHASSVKIYIILS